MMKPISLLRNGVALMAALAIFSACDNSEQLAAAKLAEARQAFEQGDFSLAKLQIDSIKLLYPKAYDVRRQGIRLMQEVELSEQTQTLAYLDSMLAIKQQAVESVLKKFVFEKDEEYEKIGHYLAPSQVIEKNLSRSYLRFRVDETGVLKMTSIYVGSSNIHHIAVKVSAPDGSFAETPASNDSYETTDLGRKIEKADYKMGEDGNVLSFLYMNRDKALRVNYQGERPYSVTMTTADRQALTNCYELAQQLSAITEIKKEMEEANLKKEFVERKMKEGEKTPATE